MKKLLLLSVATLMSIFAIAGDGSTKADAIDFSWENGHEQVANETLWYRVGLSKLSTEDSPVINLHLSNLSASAPVDVKLKATVAGQTLDREYTIQPGQNKSTSVNAAPLLRAKQTEIYIVLTTKAKDDAAKIRLSARVFDAIDLDEACKDAVAFNWKAGLVQKKGVSQWVKVDLKDAKESGKDVKITLTNLGSGELNLRAGQSLDCPSSGQTKRSFTIAAGASVTDVVPASMIGTVAGDELYVTFDNNQDLQMTAELVDQPAAPLFDFGSVTVETLPVVTNQTIAAGTHYYRISVQQMNDSAKYEPEFTFLGGAAAANLVRKMSLTEKVFGWQGDEITLAANEEKIEVIKKNVVENLSAEYVYLVIENDQPFTLIGRYKHIREGKACKTNIDFDWENGHQQDGKTTQWYAIDVKAAKAAVKDIKVTIENRGYDKATVKGALAFSCPYIDLQEITRSIAQGKSISTTIGYATYAMMTDTVFVGATTDQDIRITAELVDQKNPHVEDDACLNAKVFNWEEGAKQEAGESVWYKLGVNEVKTLQVMPTINVFNLSKDNEVKIDGVLSLECPDTKPNQERSLKIAANGVYTKQLSKNMFENISVDTIYLRVTANQPIAFEVALTEEPEGTSCTSAINFNWERGNDQKANANLWYRIDLRKAMKTDKDVKISLVNKDEKKACDGLIWLAFDCNVDAAPQEQKFTLAAGATRSTVQPHSMLETATDSVVYVRLVGNTDLHVEAELVDPAPFEEIVCPDDIVALQFDTEYEQDGGTKWYLLTKEVMAALNADATSATAFITDLSGAANKLTAEVAFHCPIASKPMTKSIELKAGQEYVKEIGENIAKQAAAHDSVIIRLTGAAKFKFEARLVKTDDGKTDRTPVRVKFGEKYTQEAGTTRFYRINTADLKADPNLNHGSYAHVKTNTLGADATLKVKVYEDMAKKEDLLEDRGKRTIGKGKGLNRNIPAYAIYGVADKIITVEVTTDQDIEIESALGQYAKLAEGKEIPLAGRKVTGKDAKGNNISVPNAQFVVPNIDYTIQPGGQWFALCLEYLRNNYKIDKSANFHVTNIDGVPVKVETTATWEDTLHYAIPHRSRTIKKTGSYSKTFFEAFDEVMKRRGYNFSISETDPAFIDSMAREAVTKEPLTAYVYINVDHPIKWRINMTRTTAFSCGEGDDDKLMHFDWEHGNFKEANKDMWYLVEMEESRIPEEKDLRLHVENWSDEANTISAEFFRACAPMNEIPGVKKVDFAAKQDSAITIPRDWIANIGWSNYQIKVTSTKEAYIWAELVEPIKHDTITEGPEIWYLCDGESAEDERTHKMHTADSSNPASLQWNDTIAGGFNDDYTMIIDTIFTYQIVIPTAPTLPAIATILPALEVKKGEAINIDAAKAALVAALDNGGDQSKQAAKEIHWEYSTDCTNFTEIDATPVTTEAFSVRFRVITDCDVELISDAVVENKIQVVNDEAVNASVACNDYTWDVDGKTYTASGTYNYEYDVPVGCGSQVEHHVATLNLTLLPLVSGEQTESACHEFTWLGKTYDKSGDYRDTIAGGAASGCDSVAILHLTISHEVVKTLTLDLKYNRILMIDRKYLLDNGWTVEELPEVAPEGMVTWYFNNALITDPKYNQKGYYLTYENGETLPVGNYSVELDLDPTGCGKRAVADAVVNYTATAAPALMPTLAQPGEDIKVLNLDPEQTTVIRIYSTEGLLQGTYTTTGAETYTIKAAEGHGFYLVELSNEGMKSTLRYVVK